MSGRYARASGSVNTIDSQEDAFKRRNRKNETRGEHSIKGDEEGNVEKSKEADVTSGTRLDISSKELPTKDGLIEAFSQLKQLQRLDMSEMKPSIENDNPDGLDTLSWLGKAVLKSKKSGKSGSPYFGKQLTWLKFSDNPSLGKMAGEKAWEGLEHLSNLSVLNASSCDLPLAPPSVTLMAWQSLGALVLGHNSIKSLPHFPSMPQLNTIVLSHNQITSLPKDLPANLPGLKKLSITHNLLQWTDNQSPLPDFSICSHLREVRISGNSQLSRLPAHLSTWGKGAGRDSKGTGLETFEAGDCGLNDWESISSLMQLNEISSTDGSGKVENAEDIHPSRRKRLRGLTTLSLRGNGVIQEKKYREKILEVHPALRVLDSVKLKDESQMQAEFQATMEKLAAPPKPIEGDHNYETKHDKFNKQRNSYNQISHDSERRTRRTEGDKASRKSHYEKTNKTDHARGAIEKGEGGKNRQSDGAKNHLRKNQSHTVLNDYVNSNHHKDAKDQTSVEENNTKKPHKRGGRGKSKGNKKKDETNELNADESSLKDPFLKSAQKSKEKEDEHLARIRARAGPSLEKSIKPSQKKNLKSKVEGAKNSLKNAKNANKADAKTAPSDQNKKRKIEVADVSQSETVNKKTKTEEKEKPKPKPQESEGSKKEDLSSVAGVVNVIKGKSKNIQKAKPVFEFNKKQQIASKGLQLGSGSAWN